MGVNTLTSIAPAPGSSDCRFLKEGGPRAGVVPGQFCDGVPSLCSGQGEASGPRVLQILAVIEQIFIPGNTRFRFHLSIKGHMESWQAIRCTAPDGQCVPMWCLGNITRLVWSGISEALTSEEFGVWCRGFGPVININPVAFDSSCNPSCGGFTGVEPSTALAISFGGPATILAGP